MLPSQNASATKPSVTLSKKMGATSQSVTSKKRVSLIKVLPSKNIGATSQSIAGLAILFQ